MSLTAPIIASSSSTMSLPSREMTDNRLFQFYLESFFKIPKEITHDIIYCQRALKAHIKVHQMVLDVFQQQPDADPVQKKRILIELETEMYEINAEQNFLFLRLRRIVDEFMKMLKKNDIPTDADATNAFISKEIVPLVNDTNFPITPTAVVARNTEEKLIEKYFEVQKDIKEPDNKAMEIIDLDADDATVENSNTDEEPPVIKTYANSRFGKKRDYSNAVTLTGDSLLKNVPFNMAATQPSLLKPFNQRMTHELLAFDVNTYNAPVKTLGDLYKRKKVETLLSQRIVQELMTEEVTPTILKPDIILDDIYQQKQEQTDEVEQKDIDRQQKDIELPVSTNVNRSRMNLRQALKRAAAVRAPSSMPIPALAPLSSAPAQSSSVALTDIVKKSNLPKSKSSRVAATSATGAAVAVSSSGSHQTSSSSEEGTPERGHTPSHNYWPDEFEETRTKADEYGQEMFLRMFDLFTPEIHAQMQQRRSKRRRRCVQNNNYHYGKIEHNHNPANPVNEPEAKKKRKAFLLSPQVKKALPAKRAKRRSADVSEAISAPTSRSASSSPDAKRSCNECLKADLNLEQCEECKSYYHAHCHYEKDEMMIVEDPQKNLDDLKKCPGCKRKHDSAVKQELLHNENLQRCAHDLELKYAKEKDRQEILERTGKSYKIQMNNLFKIVNSFKTEPTNFNAEADVILLD